MLETNIPSTKPIISAYRSDNKGGYLVVPFVNTSNNWTLLLMQISESKTVITLNNVSCSVTFTYIDI